VDKESRKKVLIVDDEPTVLKVLTKLLDDKYVVIEAKNGEEAVGMAASQQPDLILMDLMMPGMDGYQSCHTIKSSPETSMIPVVMLTALNHEINMKLGRMMGADSYLTKPFDTQELLNTVSRYTA